MIKPLFQNIVVAVNGSESSIHAAMYGIIMAKLYHARIKFIYVVDTATIRRLAMGNFLIKEESGRFEESLKSDGKKYLAYAENLAKQKNVKVETELMEGSVWVQILKACDDFGASLLLLGGSHGRHYSSDGRSSEHVVFSSTDKEIITNANCSVLVVHEPQIEQLFKLC